MVQSAPIPYVCLNTPVSYSFGAVDPDGNTLAYALVSAQSAEGVVAPYTPGFNADARPGIAMNTATGEVTFTPETQQGSYVVTVQVQQFDGNGNLIGTMVRDMQFVVEYAVQARPPSPTRVPYRT